MKLFAGLFKRNTDPVPKEGSIPSTGTAGEEKGYKKPYLTETVVFGMHQYRSPGDDSSVYFVDEKRGIRRMLVDSEGNIQNFPGIVKESFWTEEVSDYAMNPQIRFRTSFEEREDQWIMLWQIQPDGRYWADEDGFGMEKDCEVTLYTYVDQNGRFTGPFRIYRMGIRPYTLDRFLNWPRRWHPGYIQNLKDGDLTTQSIQKPEDLLFPRLRTESGWSSRDMYGLWDKHETMAYWKHPVLSKDLLEAMDILMNLDKPIDQLGGYWCRKNIHASMTLFWLVTGDRRFRAALDKFFDGKLEQDTEKLLEELPG